MSAKRRGVRVLKVTKAEVTAPERFAASARSLVAASSALAPWPPWSSTTSLKPPVEPMPRTGGGGMTLMSAPVIGARRF